MGKPTGRIERRIKLSNRAADHFKHQCDECAARCNGHHMSQQRSQWVRDNGELYFSCWNTRAWGHLECLQVGDFAAAPVVEVSP